MFLESGAAVLNEAILVTSAGTAPMRVNQYFPHFRKMVKTHQNLLCFYKGDNPRVIPDELGVLKERKVK